MKKLLIFTLVLFLSSCRSYILYEESVSFMDYSKFNEQGIFVTESNSVSFPYDAKGSLFVEIRDGYVKEIQNKVTDEGERLDTVYIEKQSNIYRAFELAIDKCKEVNADGIVNINIKILPAEYTYYNYRKYIRKYEGILITGMMIKRK